MPHRRTITTLLSLLVFAFGAWAQNPPADKDRQRKPSRHSGLPVVGEFERPHGSVADEVQRQSREQFYENTGTRFGQGPDNKPRGDDPGTFAEGAKESTTSTIIDYITTTVAGAHQDPQGIPASSTTVIIGTVLSGNSFVSKNRTAVYSDYQIRIDEILKPNPTATLVVGGEVVGSRAGGAIHYPSDHTTNFLLIGHGLPEIGSQYVLFLWKPVPNQPVWEIAFDSGYQLKNGRVYALDEVNEQLYDDMSVPVFLDVVKKAIVASQNNGGKP